MPGRNSLGAAAFLLAALFFLTPAAQAKKEHAKLRVTGDGLIGDLELRTTLLTLEAAGKKLPSYNADFIEDAVAILFSRLTDNGYLHPKIGVDAVLTNGNTARYEWTNAFDQTLPRPFIATNVEFQVQRGVRYYYDTIAISGLHSIPLPTAVTYFETTGSLLHLKSERIYSQARLRRAVASLTDALQNQGYADAHAVPTVKANDQTGAVAVRLDVSEGLPTIVEQVRLVISGVKTNAPPEVKLYYPQRPYSTFWQQDFIQFVKTNYYRGGYPDVAVTLHPVATQTNDGRIYLQIEGEAQTGPQVRLGVVVIEGQRQTRDSVLIRRAQLKPGGLLDRTQVEQARYRLSELGVFDSVNYTLKPVDDETRDAIFDLKEGTHIETSLLFGFGTYELLRGGFELQQHNLLGLADSSQLRLSQSFKTSSAYYVFTLPDLVAPNVNLFFDAEALRRQELSFLREEYGGGLGVETYLRSISTDLSLRYNYALLTAVEDFVDPADGLASAVAGAFIIDIKNDKRDNPLNPHHGYKIFANLEVASQDFGGDVNYERYDISTSYHFPVGDGQWLHLGLEDGAVFTDRGPRYDLPFDRRFFPGGEDSIRGYLEGEAASRDAAGNLVGAETMMLGSVEFEQALTTKLSAVFFVDTLGEARRIADYPFDQVLVSIGPGLGWRTLIGPIRLEYGYNVNPRRYDPSGTIQVSVGFPF